MRLLLDTSAVIDPHGVDLEAEWAISVVTLAELHFGVLVARDDELRATRLRRLTQTRAAFDPIPVDERVATAWGELAARVAGKGRQHRRRSMDLFIAATAHVHDLPLVTRNAADLAGLESSVTIVGL